ncbi:hypothetical protein PV327_011677 [Microctonus hyperodae]|uniref:Uncharacterized protein n=1 Tax=Microctonus hyperodae TaxID=165561 RepID=A0AA39C297_MICHY|nr:hypothetical protein PV327_011677 [Microctonus hyperodae]
MENVMHITSDLCPAEMRFLKFVPAQAINYNGIMEKNFGDKPPVGKYQYQNDLINFNDSIIRIVRLREAKAEINGRKICAKCECFEKVHRTIISVADQMMDLADDLIMELGRNEQTLREIIGKKRVNDVVDGRQDITTATTSATNDGVYDVAGNGSPMNLQKKIKNSGNSGEDIVTSENAAEDDDKRIHKLIMKIDIDSMREKGIKIFNMSTQLYETKDL